MFGLDTLKFLGCVNISHVDSGTLARAAGQLKEEQGATMRATKHLEALLSAVPWGPPTLRSLTLSKNTLSLVKPGLLSFIVASMEEVNMEDVFLTSEQVVTLFLTLSAPDCLLRRFKIGVNNLSSVEPGRLARALVRLENVDLQDTKLTSSQAQTLLASLANSQRNLTRLNLCSNDLSWVEAPLLARVVASTQEVHLRDTSLTALQAREICLAIKSSCKLRSLDLGSNLLSFVEPRLLARAVNRLQEVELQETELSERQVQEVLSVAVEESTSLTRLGLGNLNFEADMFLVHQAKKVIKDLQV